MPTPTAEQRVTQVSPDWLSLLAGPLTWSGFFLIGYVLAEFGCKGGWLRGQIAGLPTASVVIAVLTVAALGLSIWAGWRTWRRWGAIRADPDAQLSRVEERQRFMTLGGLLLSGLFSLAIVLTGIPAVVLEPC